MDPADTGHQSKTADKLSQALASQGVLVGHHDVVLREVVETLRNLSANVQRIGTQVELLTTQYSPPQPAAQPAAPPPAPAAPLYQLREAVIPTPERYAGDLERDVGIGIAVTPIPATPHLIPKLGLPLPQCPDPSRFLTPVFPNQGYAYP
ncbi:hypothetical protein NQZ68_018466 [Dissostichus eleginoides]|nr:hypothetical protein NQZ68_018466 [Dissostichus eleginoides]